jgi:hypothetical protein
MATNMSRVMEFSDAFPIARERVERRGVLLENLDDE